MVGHQTVSVGSSHENLEKIPINIDPEMLFFPLATISYSHPIVSISGMVLLRIC